METSDLSKVWGSSFWFSQRVQYPQVPRSFRGTEQLIPPLSSNSRIQIYFRGNPFLAFVSLWICVRVSSSSSLFRCMWDMWKFVQIQGWDSRFRGIPARWLKISLHVVFLRYFRGFPRFFCAVVIKALLNSRRGNHVWFVKNSLSAEFPAGNRN